MAGFAVNVNFLLSRVNASMPYKPGYEEDGFLKSLSPLKLTEIELLASNCTEVGGLSTVDGDKLQIYFILMQIKFHRRRPLSIFFPSSLQFSIFQFHFADPRLAHAIKKESQRYGTGHGKI